MNDRKRSNSLSTKIVITIIAFVTICSLIWGIALTNHMMTSLVESMRKDEQTKLDQVAQAIDTTREVCNFATEVVNQSVRLTNYLEQLHEGRDMAIEEKLEFYSQELASIENMSNANPYLHQVRVYVNSDIVSEKAPSFYRYDRLANLSWGGEYSDGEWKLDYADTIFPDYVATPAQHVAGLISVTKNSEGEEIYLVECISYMESLFPGLYENSDSEWSAFYAKDGQSYHVEHKENLWNEHKDEIREELLQGAGIRQATIGGRHVILAAMEVPGLQGTYVHLLSLEETMKGFYSSLGIYLLAMCIILIAFVFVSNFAVRMIMQRFYKLYDVMTEIRGGNLELSLPEEGEDDEITELSREINRMLDRIKELNQDNLDRQLLAKNAQIKSLQNQINAHFMYNVLESIKMMAEIEGKYDISDAITSLGKMLRYSMKWMTGIVTVGQEIEYIKNYLKLLNLRFDYEIYLSLNIPDEIYDLEIPKMLLQPLVENAIYHGIEEMAEDTNIYIKGIIVNDEECAIEVADAGRGMSEETLEELRKKIYSEERVTEEGAHGIGLKNVQDRVQLYFGESYGLEVYSKEGCYTKVLIRLPRNMTIDLVNH